MGNANYLSGVLSWQAHPTVFQKPRTMLLKESRLYALVSSISHISASRTRVLTKSEEFVILCTSLLLVFHLKAGEMKIILAYNASHYQRDTRVLWGHVKLI